ncbi:hypothetical protein ACFE04_023390 [Oxalis oulophora]
MDCCASVLFILTAISQMEFLESELPPTIVLARSISGDNPIPPSSLPHTMTTASPPFSSHHFNNHTPLPLLPLLAVPLLPSRTPSQPFSLDSPYLPTTLDPVVPHLVDGYLIN